MGFRLAAIESALERGSWVANFSDIAAVHPRIESDYPDRNGLLPGMMAVLSRAVDGLAAPGLAKAN